MAMATWPLVRATCHHNRCVILDTQLTKEVELHVVASSFVSSFKTFLR
ncbi:MAG: hypothetical protein GFH27_549301n150 [Chloroflexi bacterium AL-W]|nr:hypothetical protein [Chloroflexi bacterium AL-N1]NOK68343.1 hypothetical protein [Chloroflexi bacterium AL-N10]NOK73989.1 hypothetical protein [Chloroflexi bacterium AL-N5]NOK82957.1 hypothetical protein [Chloroflexi bacterium AL-W]NOK90479.1 hypothetical protein [Chloroflexi bacterium AL-N15]